MRLWWCAVAALFGASAAAMPVRPGVWAQSYVGRAADPAIVFGQLPNGLRYAVMHNATPPGQVSMRLGIAAGSLVERDDQLGLAHFVEHMAFRGTTHVPDGELMRTLERRGLRVGADTNAFTTAEATFYQFDLPENDGATVATGLRFLRAAASEVSFAPGTVAAERAVIAAEERARDSSAMHAQKALIGSLLAGQRATDRWPIGRAAIIAAATPAQLRDFYQAHYRPGNATVIVTGDIDPAAVVAAITAQFGDWAAGPPPPAVDLGTPAAHGVDARVFAEPGVTHAVTLAWTRPFDAEADTVAHRRAVLIERLGVRILNQRLQDIALAADPPYLSAGIERTNVLRSANATIIEVRAPFEAWPEGATAVLAEQRRMLAGGVTAAEVARVVTQTRTALTAARDGAATRSTPALAGLLLNAALRDYVVTSPAQDLAEFEAAILTIDPRVVDESFRHAFDGAGPLLFLTAAGPVPGGEAKLRQVYAAASTAPIAVAAVAGTAAWPYDSFGAPGRVVARRTVPGLGVTVVDFANGATLLIKPTAFAKGGIEVDVHFGLGRAGLRPYLSHAVWAAAGIVPVFVSGGTGKLSLSDIQRLLADRVAGIDMVTGDAAFDLRGHTRPADLPRQLQLLTAYLVDPGFRPEAFERLKSATASSLNQLDADPGLVLLRALPRALHAGDPRWAVVPDRAEIAKTTLSDVRALFRPALAEGKLGVVVVGDVDVDAAIEAVAATIGTLPPRDAPQLAPRAGVYFPAASAVPQTALHRGRADKAIAIVAWPATDFYAQPRDARALIVTRELLRSRLIDRLRGADGLTYAPDVDIDFSNDFDGYGNVIARIEVAPDRVDDYFAKLSTIVRDLNDHAPTPDEIERARTPVIEARLHDLQNNAYWAGALARATRDPREFTSIAERVTAVRAVTAADVRRVVQTYLRPDRAFRLVVRPAPPAVPTILPSLLRPPKPSLLRPRAAPPIAACTSRFVRACTPG